MTRRNLQLSKNMFFSSVEEIQAFFNKKASELLAERDKVIKKRTRTAALFLVLIIWHNALHAWQPFGWLSFSVTIIIDLVCSFIVVYELFRRSVESEAYLMVRAEVLNQKDAIVKAIEEHKRKERGY